MAEHHFLAMDLGAESGRAILTTLRDETVTMEEIHRWPNRPVRMAGTLTWDFPFLYTEVLESLKRVVERGQKVQGLSVDTWGVDFGLLGEDGRLLGNPSHYRDSRTDGIYDYTDPILSREAQFGITGYEPWPLASIMQLAAMKRDDWPALRLARTFLNIPDLFNYFLTGQARGDRSVVNTGGLMATDGSWAREIIQAFDLPEMFPELIEPGTVLGEMSPEVVDATGLGGVPVIVTCGHDTSAAVAAVPAEGTHWAYLSCGTWSIVGCLVDEPITDPKCLQLGFTNEYTIGGWYLGRNVLGLWLVQELKRKWDTLADKWDYVRMTAEAASAKDGPLVDVANEAFLAPADMEAALIAELDRTGQPKPETRGELIRCVLESLALEYNHRMDALGELTGRRPEALYMVGGGIKNQLLCRLTAQACGIPVYAGADQCTAMGNALGQALALGVLKDRDAIRQVMRASFEVKRYDPADDAIWQDKRATYAKLQAM
jgi:rhamnulokinase